MLDICRTMNAFLLLLCLVLFCICLNVYHINLIEGFVFFPRGGSFGYLAAVAIPLDLPNRNVYMAFNFESNYGLPSNDSYNEWIDRWNLDQNFLGIGNNVTPINGRHLLEDEQPTVTPTLSRYRRSTFYRSVANYLTYFGMNGSACLQRTICEVNSYHLDVSNGLLGSLLKILFTTTASQLESEIVASAEATQLYAAEHFREDCAAAYGKWCPHGILDMISL